MNNLNVLTRIYDTAFSESRWQPALDDCCELMGAIASNVYEISNLSCIDYSLGEHSSAFLAAKDIMLEYQKMLAKKQDSGFDNEGLERNQKAKLFSVTLDEEVWTLDNDYYRRPEVKLGVKAGFVRRAIANLSDDPSVYRGVIFFYGEQCRNSLPRWTRERGEALAPHLAKAIELNRLSSELRRRYNAALSVLDKIDVGIFLVTNNLEIILKNAAADSILERADGLRASKSGRLECHNLDSNEHLKSLVSRASEIAEGEWEQLGDPLRIRRREFLEPLVADVAPLRDADVELEHGLTGAIVTVIDSSRREFLDTRLLARTYGLTSAEERLSQFLVRGLTNKEISARLNVSPETVKSQVASTFAKCGCKNRTTFVWRAFQFNPPFF